MDVLSEVLRVIRLSGAVHFRGEFKSPWSFISSSPDALPARIRPGAESITVFHVVTNGSCWVTSGKYPPIRVEQGDVIVLARADQHVMASDPGLSPVPIKNIYPQTSPDQITVLKHGGGGEESRFICGYLHSDQRFGPLLDAMPALICVRVRNGTLILESFADNARTATSHTLTHKADWWQAAIGNLISEATMLGQGNGAVLARLSELLFMEIVRWQLTFASEGHGGWLAGLNDPHVGRALALLHAEPARAWSVEELAQRAAISRAGLAKRFVELVGETPMQYLTEWRMHLARRLLLEHTLSLAEIAARVGYDSEATFNRAFRRVVGTPPAAWRQAKTTIRESIEALPDRKDKDRTDPARPNVNSLA
jgi:AraC family transcriptional regulator, alkane utilization regulator